MIRSLSDQKMAAYRAPFLAREARLPTPVWPRQLAIAGETGRKKAGKTKNIRLPDVDRSSIGYVTDYSVRELPFHGQDASTPVVAVFADQKETWKITQ